MKTFGSPNYIRTPQLRDTEEMVTASLYGSRSRMAYDLPNAKYILSFGAALLDGWGTPTWVAQAYREWRRDTEGRKGQLVQVEPLASTTASLADEWVPVKPGTEGIPGLGDWPRS